MIDFQYLAASIDELNDGFNSACRTALDSVAPIKIRQPKPKTEPWFNEATRSARRECRKAERKWKKDKLQVSYRMLRDSWHVYQKTVKAEKSKHFSDIIATNGHNPQILYETIKFVLNGRQTASYVDSPKLLTF